MSSLNKSKNRVYVIAMPVKKYNDGNDFVIDTIPFFKKHGYTFYNTRKYGVLFSLFYELYLFIKIKRYTTVITTWPGFPKIVIFDKLHLNWVRIFIFKFFLKLKKWNYVVIPIDLHIYNAKNRISEIRYKDLLKIENSVFRQVNIFIACGEVLSNKFTKEYRNSKVYKMDMYDQVLPLYRNVAKKVNPHNIKIVILGNLIRMLDNIDELPQSKNISYYFIGKNGEVLQQFIRSDFKYLGEIPDSDLLKTLHDFDFGLIFYSGKVDYYFSQVISGKTTSYLYAGLPILCPKKYTSIAALAKEKMVGHVISSINSIPCEIEKILPCYDKFKENCLKESEKIRCFKHYEETLKKAKLI